MKIFKTFGYVYYNSISSLAYYKDVLATKTSFSIKYVLALGLIFTLITTANFTLRVFPEVKAFVDKLPAEVAKAYPDDLVISGKNNEWFINQPEPYAIPFTYNELFKETDTLARKNLVVFDKLGTMETFADYNTLLLISGKYVYAQDSNNKISATPLTEIPEGSFAKQDLLTFVAQTMPLVKGIVSVTPLVVGLFYLLANTSMMLFYTLILGLLLMLLSALFRRGLTYTEGFKIGLHAITLPWTIKVLISLIGVSIPIPLWFTLLALMVGGSAIYSLPEKTVSATPTSLN
ncbi:MAG: hypothetical protein RLY61_216 [Candidatus Parcubacteria bacterium]|jgi:hypothetical protein